MWTEIEVLPLIIDICVDATKYHHIDPQKLKRDFYKHLNGDVWPLDSLGTYQAASFVACFFSIHSAADLDELLTEKHLLYWAKIGAVQLNKKDCAITFMTSGSQGKPKKVSHLLSILSQEVIAWSVFAQSYNSVIRLVPCHHIYGFLWTVLLPKLFDKSVIDCRSTGLIFEGSVGNSLIVMVPDMLSLLAVMNDTEHLAVVVSGGPCAHKELVSTAQLGFKQVLQIYGSTETGGIGWRDAESERYRLRTGLAWQGSEIMSGDHFLDIQDVLNRHSDGSFIVVGRKDNMIQVKGQNISPENIKQRMLSIAGITDCALRIETYQETTSIKLFACVDNTRPKEEMVFDIIQQSGRLISPVNITFGGSLPKNDMGKIVAW